MNRSARALALAVALVAFVAAGGTAHGATHTVCLLTSPHTPCNFTSPKAAAAAAADGDTLQVFDGTYVELTGVQITNKGLTIQGESTAGTIIDGQGSPTRPAGTLGQLDLRVNAATGARTNNVSDLTIRNAIGTVPPPFPTPTPPRFAVYATAATTGSAFNFDRVRVVGRGANGNDFGVYSENSQAAFRFNLGSVSNTAFNPLLLENVEAATTVEDSNLAEALGGGSAYALLRSCVPPQAGCQVNNTNPQIVRNNDIAGNGPAIFTGVPLNGCNTVASRVTGGLTDVSITDNLITGLRAGDSGISLNNCDATGGGAGSVIADPDISNNTVIGADLTSSSGINVRGFVSNASITGNTVRDAFRGIRVLPALFGGNVPAGTQANLNRIVGNGVGLENTTSGSVDAQQDWWGCNGGPGIPGCDGISNTGGGSVDGDPWLVLDFTGPTTLATGANANYVASLDQDSDGGAVVLPANFTGLPMTFAASGGSITSPVPLNAGSATAAFTAPGTNGNVALSTKLDNGLVTLPVQIGSGGGGGGTDTGGGGASGGSGGQPAVTPGFGGRTNVSLRLSVPASTSRKNKVRVKVRSENPFKLKGVLFLRTKGPVRLADGRVRTVRLRTTNFTLGDNGLKTLSVRLPYSLRKLLRAEGELRLFGTVVLADPRAAVRSVSKTLVPKLRKPGNVELR